MRRFLLSSSVLLTMLALPLSALAHEHRTYVIAGKPYSIVVGSLNEPVHVDDKTGVEVIVSDLSVPKVIQQPGADGEDGPSGNPVIGLEKDLKVEISAGDQKKIFDLQPEDGVPGSYEAVFYPTVQTTYSYRVFGTLNNTPIDVNYACSPAATADVPEDTTSVTVSDKVTQTLKGGAFGCPEAKTAVEFPQQPQSLTELSAKVNDTGATGMAELGLVTALVALVMAAGAWRKASKRMS